MKVHELNLKALYDEAKDVTNQLTKLKAQKAKVAHSKTEEGKAEKLRLSKIPTPKFEASIITSNRVSFVNQSLAIFSHVPLIRNEANLVSMKQTMDALPASIKIGGGEFIDKENLIGLILIIYELQRSFFVSAMKKTPQHSSFVPLFMYAQKSEHGIQYEEWDKEDPTLKYVLGRTLEKAIAISQLTLTADEVSELRQQGLTYKTGKRAGEMENLQSHKMPIGLLVVRDGVEVAIPKEACYMLLQTWTCSAGIRDVNSMILDPWNWDNVPEALDVAVPKPTPASTDPGRSEYKLPW